MSLLRSSTGVVFVGAGPAGLAPLFAAATAGRLSELLARGVIILERGDRLGAGALPSYAITSDSTAESFLDIVMHSGEPSLRALRGHPLAQELATLGKAAAPLTLAGQFLELAGTALCNLVAASERGAVLRRAEAIAVTRAETGRWRTRFRRTDTGVEAEIESSAVVLALGGSQPQQRLRAEPIAEMPLLPRFADKVMQSGELLAHDGLDQVARRLQGIARPRVVVVGGSTSAGASAARLLQPASPVRFGVGSVVLMHREPLRIFHESASAALADGYSEFREEDVCALTGRVYRFSGFRLDSRDLIMAVRGIGNRPKEERLRLLQLLPEREEEARECLASADLIVAALGYRPKRLPIYKQNGERFALANPSAACWSTVDGGCQLQTDQGASLPNLYAIGLAVGPAPTRELGGELGFQGQVNSLWMWQHVLGLRIVDGLLRVVPLPRSMMSQATRAARQGSNMRHLQSARISSQGPVAAAENGGFR